MSRRKPRDPAWIPPAYEASDIEAIQAVHAGTANAHQQRRALDWIIETAAATYDMPFRSDADGGERDTSFALGRIFVGQQIIKLVKMSPAVTARLRKPNGR